MIGCPFRLEAWDIMTPLLFSRRPCNAVNNSEMGATLSRPVCGQFPATWPAHQFHWLSSGQCTVAVAELPLLYLRFCQSFLNGIYTCVIFIPSPNRTWVLPWIWLLTRTRLFTNKPCVFDRSTELLLRFFVLNLDRGAFANDIDHSDTTYRARRLQYKHARDG